MAPRARAIRPLAAGGLAATVRLPGSKSFTHRALICAALAGGESFLAGALAAEDTHLSADALTDLGARVTWEAEGARVIGTAGRLRRPRSAIMLGNSGTSMRLLTAVAALCREGGEITLDGNEAMRRRPIGELVAALNELGVEAASRGGCPPVTVAARGIPGGRCRVDASRSSQFVSALLLAAPYAEREVTVEVSGEVVSRPYIEMTRQTMTDFGVAAEVVSAKEFRVRSGQRYRPRERYLVEADGSNASYFAAAAAAVEGRVRAEGLRADSLQGDAGFLSALERMGCTVKREAEAAEVSCAGPLQAVDIDMGGMPDVVPSLAVLAALAQGTTRIRNVGHLRVKECDRLSALATELSRCGVRVEEREGELIIEGGGAHGAEIETYDDHRLAMSFAVLGLAVPGISIKEPGCVAKSFPDFWERFEGLYAQGPAAPECCGTKAPARRAGKSGAQAGGPSRVVLIGYRCSGKTSVGQVLAARLGWRFVDSDAEVERAAGRTIAEIVDAEGWPGFRDRERAAVKALAARRRVVIAAGGGAVCDEANRARFRKRDTFVVYLVCDPQTIAARLAADRQTATQRPSLSGKGVLQEVTEVLAEREPVYQAAADCRIEAAGRGIGEIAAEIGRLIEEAS